MSNPKYKTRLFAEAKVLEPGSVRFKAVASAVKSRYGIDLQPQMDLLYIESCLVTAGDLEGINDNDDIFIREEVWASRQTPILKPLNWQHTDTDIVGVMYSVQARDLEGNVLDFNEVTPPDTAFELWTEAVLFSLVHVDRSREVQERSAQGNLFVSMEAWFDDYHYGLFNEGGVVKTIARNESTSFLENSLRASGGVGKYVDPDTGQEMRIGRVLRSITFGGCGLVDRPANKRSKIEEAKPMLELAGSSSTDDEIKLLLQRVLEQVSKSTEEVVMNANASANGLTPDDVKAAVADEMTDRDNKAKAAQERADLDEALAQAKAKNEELAAEVSALTEAKEAKDAEVKSLNEQLAAYDEAVTEFIGTEAGATGSTPAEIAAIDSASDGTGAFNAKLAWLEKSRASLQERAARADELEAQLTEAEAIVREQDVRVLFGETMSAEAVDYFVTHAKDLDAEAYGQWRAEKELMVIEMATAADDKKEKKLPPFMQKIKDKGKDKEKDAKAASNTFLLALLEQRRGEAGSASPDTPPYEPHLINPVEGDSAPKSGVTPGSPGLSTPRHKIAGSAGNDPAAILEAAQADDSGVNFAGASNASDDGENVNPFRTLANVVCEVAEDSGNEETQSESGDKPGFDPVRR